MSEPNDAELMKLARQEREKDMSTSDRINDIAVRVLVPGNEMSRVYWGVFDALKAIAEALDRIEANTTPDKDEP